MRSRKKLRRRGEKKRSREDLNIIAQSKYYMNIRVVPLNINDDTGGGTQLSVHKPRENILDAVQEESDDSDDSTKKREKELFSLALKPIFYLGRA